MPCPEPVLDLADVAVARGSFRVSIDRLEVGRGETVVVTGPSGSGKSSVLDLLAGILRPVAAGRFGLCGVDVSALWSAGDHDGLRAMRAAHLGYVMQTGGLAPFLSIAENVALPFWRDGETGGVAVEAALSALGIGDLAGRMPRHVSVGQRQRAAIARALVGRPALVLADEPTAALDPDTAAGVVEGMLALTRDYHTTLVLVTHDMHLAERVACRSAGRVLNCEREGPGRTRLVTR